MSRSYYIKFYRQDPLTTEEQNKLLSIIDDYDFPKESLKGELYFWRKPTVNCYPKEILKKFNDPNLIIYFVPKDELDDFIYGDGEKYKYILTNEKLNRINKFESKIEQLIIKECRSLTKAPFERIIRNNSINENLIWLSSGYLDIQVYYFTDKDKNKSYKLIVKTSFWTIERNEKCYSLRDLIVKLSRAVCALENI